MAGTSTPAWRTRPNEREKDGALVPPLIRVAGREAANAIRKVCSHFEPRADRSRFALPGAPGISTSPVWLQRERKGCDGLFPRASSAGNDDANSGGHGAREPFGTGRARPNRTHFRLQRAMALSSFPPHPERIFCG